MLEILSNGRLMNSEASIQSKSREVVMREIDNENEVCTNVLMREEIKLVLEVLHFALGVGHLIGHQWRIH
ncbi:unnamed protein product [Prunus armeniaca]